jgi:hypothetical protein
LSPAALGEVLPIAPRLPELAARGVAWPDAASAAATAQLGWQVSTGGVRAAGASMQMRPEPPRVTVPVRLQRSGRAVRLAARRRLITGARPRAAVVQ